MAIDLEEAMAAKQADVGPVRSDYTPSSTLWSDAKVLR